LKVKKLFFENKTTVVNIKYEYNYDIYIGRGFCPLTRKESIWGNPYSHKEKSIAKYKTTSIEESLKKYKEYVLNSPILLKKLSELKGKILGCWCVEKNWKQKNNISEYKCHGEILIDLLNEIK